ncbi:hypothetical protein B0H67DRAFT_655097 [Lasiosphaeris hirsuta]|uniref:Heterokaryon incompatibility domain-containing protein n=1 Tax=Lasiosphaeris hirsuta TaxID=260670 RepID=A0AA40BDG6_9PEZI|nr:hypothetical protein B0H67DRAFT_655097 [Lasiosphaeris hirsuta]
MTDSSRGLEKLRVAASRRSEVGLDAKKASSMIRSLLGPSWFRRVWVLQEVAPARYVVMVSRSMETDGYGFCVELEAALDLARPPLLDSDSENAARSAVYLIKEASLRPKRATSREDRFCLDACPLRELLDLYEDRKATDRRDKLYALIGISSDLVIPPYLLPDYNKAWPELFQQLFIPIVG